MCVPLNALAIEVGTLPSKVSLPSHHDRQCTMWAPEENKWQGDAHDDDTFFLENAALYAGKVFKCSKRNKVDENHSSLLAHTHISVFRPVVPCSRLIVHRRFL